MSPEAMLQPVFLSSDEAIVVPIIPVPGANECSVSVDLESLDSVSGDVLTMQIQGSPDRQNWTTLATRDVLAVGLASLAATSVTLPNLRYKLSLSGTVAMLRAKASSSKL
jgi:hypothetical protein